MSLPLTAVLLSSLFLWSQIQIVENQQQQLQLGNACQYPDSNPQAQCPEGTECRQCVNASGFCTANETSDGSFARCMCPLQNNSLLETVYLGLKNLTGCKQTLTSNVDTILNSEVKPPDSCESSEDCPAKSPFLVCLLPPNAAAREQGQCLCTDNTVASSNRSLCYDLNWPVVSAGVCRSDQDCRANSRCAIQHGKTVCLCDPGTFLSKDKYESCILSNGTLPQNCSEDRDCRGEGLGHGKCVRAKFTALAAARDNLLTFCANDVAQKTIESSVSRRGGFGINSATLGLVVGVFGVAGMGIFVFVLINSKQKRELMEIGIIVKRRKVSWSQTSSRKRNRKRKWQQMSFDFVTNEKHVQVTNDKKPDVTNKKHADVTNKKQADVTNEQQAGEANKEHVEVTNEKEAGVTNEKQADVISPRTSFIAVADDTKSTSGTQHFRGEKTQSLMSVLLNKVPGSDTQEQSESDT